MICIQNLSFSYPDQEPVLKNIDLNIAEGDYIAVIGPNGSGKTTLIKHLNALLLPSAGEVLVDGLSTSNPKNLPEIRRRVGMIFQNPDNQIVGMSVEEDVAFGPGNLGLPPKEVRKRVDEALEKVGLTNYKSRPPYTLSGGQKQLLAIAGVLAMDSRYIVLDEPTASLDPQSNYKVLNLLKKLNYEGIGIIHVTHNMDDLIIANRLLVMDQGKLITDGPAADILSQVESLKAIGLTPPKVTELMYCLNQRGAAVATNICTVEEAVEEINSLLIKLQNPVDHNRRETEHV
ncbi:MAG: energy-coupling factor transporter ATPase [Syntrophomonadaceae bacterium]|nr:energy-coupling factor transporter ATPase [Syntrophomonadaceae bacterium]